MDAKDIEVNQIVRVFDVNGRRKGQPADGWEGRIEKIGRTLVHIHFQGQTKTFRLDTRTTNDGYGHASFLTLPEVDRQQRYDAAMAVLGSVSLRYEGHRRAPLELVEAVAETVRKYLQDHPPESHRP